MEPTNKAPTSALLDDGTVAVRVVIIGPDGVAVPANGAPFSSFARSDQEDPGSINFAVDGSVTPVNFDFVCPAGVVARVSKLRVCFRAGAAAMADPSKFFGIDELENGIEIQHVEADGETVIKSWARDIKALADWAIYGGTITAYPDPATATQGTLVWDLPAPITLAAGESLRLVVSDDLSSGEEPLPQYAGIFIVDGATFAA